MELKKDIILIVPSIKRGGTEKIVIFLYNNLPRNKYNVKLIVLDDIYISDLLIDSSNIICFHKKSVSRSIITLIKFLKKQNHGIIVLSFFDNLNILLCIFKSFRFIKCPLITRSSTVLTHYYAANNMFISAILAKIFYRFSTLLICQSEQMYFDFISIGINKEKLKILRNPIFSLEAQNNDEIDYRFREAVNRFVTVGNLRPEKGYDRLIPVFKVLKNRISDAMLFILGDGSEKDKIKMLIKKYELEDCVFLLGECNNVSSYLALTNVFLFTSYFEGYPNAVIEALSYKIPVVAYSDCKVLNELITNGINGYLIDSDSPNLFVEAAINAISLKIPAENHLKFINSHCPNNFITSIDTYLSNI